MNSNKQVNNLSTFKILFLVKGILMLLASIFFMAYALIGRFIGNLDEFSEGENQMPFSPGIIFIVVGGIGFILSVIMGIVTLLASKYIKEISNYKFIFVVAILNCLTGILGIVLGIFTIIELNKEPVKELFTTGKKRG
ncbi:MAG: hypothetical protein V3U92_18550 [Cellulophaga sp.]